MNSGDRNRSIPSGKGSSKYGSMNDGTPGSIIGKYYKNNQGMAGAQNYNPGGGLSKGGLGNGDSYGIYGGAGGGLSKGGLSKALRKDSNKVDKPPAYGGFNYGAPGISKYRNKDYDDKEERLPSVTNRQALGNDSSAGSKRSIGSKIGSKEGSRGKIPSGGALGGFGDIARQKDSSNGLPNLNKHSGAGGLGGLNKGGLSKAGLGSLGGGLSKGGLGRYNL